MDGTIEFMIFGVSMSAAIAAHDPGCFARNEAAGMPADFRRDSANEPLRRLLKDRRGRLGLPHAGLLARAAEIEALGAEGAQYHPLHRREPLRRLGVEAHGFG